MDALQSKQSLVDDPQFLASLAILDDGLIDNGPITAAGSFPANVSQAPPLGDAFGAPPPEVHRAPAPIVSAAPPARAERPRAPAPEPAREVSDYETFYSLNESPFGESGSPDFFYHSRSHDDAADALLTALASREPLMTLTGEHSVGKTVLCRFVMGQLDRRTLTCNLSDPPGTVDDLLRTVLVQFGVVSRQDVARGHLTGATHAQLTDALTNFLASLGPLQASAVVFIDNAHDLPSPVLDGIGKLAAAGNSQTLLQFVLVGDAGLLPRLSRPALRPLAAGAVRVELKRLGRDDVPGYVMHRIGTAGSSTRVDFSDAACATVYELSRGVPGTINMLCDRALALGYEKSASVIDAGLVKRAGREMNLESGAPAKMTPLATGMVALAFFVLILIGGAAALWVFSDRVEGALAQWAGSPAPPASVTLPTPSVLAPLSPPQ